LFQENGLEVLISQADHLVAEKVQVALERSDFRKNVLVGHGGRIEKYSLRIFIYCFNQFIDGGNMAKLPDAVFNLLNERSSSKILGTKNAKGDVHLINVGGAGAVDPETIFVGQIFMKATSENLEHSKKDGSHASMLVSKGPESYEVRCSVKDHVTAGPMFDKMKETFKAMKFDLKGLWLLKVEEVYNESPTWDSGRKMV